MKKLKLLINVDTEKFKADTSTNTNYDLDAPLRKLKGNARPDKGIKHIFFSLKIQLYNINFNHE